MLLSWGFEHLVKDQCMICDHVLRLKAFETIVLCSPWVSLSVWLACFLLGWLLVLFRLGPSVRRDSQ